jgi:hypothetical protein
MDCNIVIFKTENSTPAFIHKVDAAPAINGRLKDDYTAI